MEKTKMMKRYEAETGEILDIDHLSADANGSWCGYIEELEGELRGLKALNKWSKEELTTYKTKAAAYDRLMSGGKKTLKEWANFTGYVTAVQDNGVGIASRDKPIIVEELGDTGWYPTEADIEAYHYFTIHESLIDYSGDWKDSLTLPDGWEEK